MSGTEIVDISRFVSCFSVSGEGRVGVKGGTVDLRKGRLDEKRASAANKEKEVWRERRNTCGPKKDRSVFKTAPQ